MPSVSDALSSAGSGAAAGTAIMPGWGTVIGGVAGLASSFLGGNKKPTALPQNAYNMYGQLNQPNTGAITSMQDVFSNINGQPFQNNINSATNNYASALGNAANNPGLASIYNFGQKTLNGDFLQNPTVNGYANQAFNSQLAAGADQAAQTRARYARAGLGFSTTNQQAQDADMAAVAQRASTTRAGILTQNEQYERGLQQQAPGMISSAISQPLSYLSQIPSAYYSPLQMQAGLTTQLAGGANVSTPQYYQAPGFSDQLAGGIQQGAGLASILNSIKRPPATAPTGPSYGGT